MIVNSARTKAALLAVILILTVVPTALLHTGDAAESEPVCDHCHDTHDRVYHAYLDITRFLVPSVLNGTDVSVVEVQLHLHGNVGQGYCTVSWGRLTLKANNDRVGIEQPKQEFISMVPGFWSFYWNVTGRLEGTDTLHVSVSAHAIHFVGFGESGNSGPILVTNPVNAPPRVSFAQPDGYDDVANNSYQVALTIDDPNNDRMLADFYYDTDRDRSNGATIIARSVAFPETHTWETRGIPNGWYYIHVDVDDQMGGHDFETSYHPVIVSHGNRVPNAELVSPLKNGVVRDPGINFTWRSEDLDGDVLTYEVWVGLDTEHMELVGTTEQTSLKHEPDDNSRLYWIVIPNDGTIRGWCRNGPRMFITDIDYPVEVDLILPPDGSVVPGPDVKLVWYGRDLDFERVLYRVWLEHDGETIRLVGGWDDPAGPVLVVPDLVPGETYIWWVEGDNPYSTMGVSDRWSFTVASDAVPVAQLDDEQFDLDGVTLFWSPSAQGVTPDHYDVHLVDHIGGDTLLIAGTGDTSISYHGLVEDTTYHWYVIPYDADGGQGHSIPSFRTFLYDTNSPPTANISHPYLEVTPGPHFLEWSGNDPDGDPISYDIYLDPVNATDLVAGNINATRLQVDLDADRMYFWRVVPRDTQSVGEAAVGVVVTGPEGTDLGATGSLLSPADGANVTPPMVNLTWEASDPLNRTLLYSLYLNISGGDPLAGPPLVLNATTPWFVMELEDGTDVSWAVEVRPLRGPVSLLGSASFTVDRGATGEPFARLVVNDVINATDVLVGALEAVSFAGLDGPLDQGPLEYQFDFGDGTASGWTERSEAKHTYLKEGVYNASLTVRSPEGLTSEPSVVQVTVVPGDTSSDEPVPGLTAALGALAMLGASLVAFSARRRWIAGGGTE